MLDNDIIETFRARAEANGTGYQTVISAEPPLTAETLRQILRQELHST